MRKWISFLMVLPMLLIAGLAFGQDPTAPVPTEDFLKFLVDSLGGLKGASSLVIAGFVTQALLMLAKTPLMGGVWNKVGGAWKLTVVLGLSLVSGVLGLMLSGVDLGAALVHSTTLTAFMVFMNQIYKQFLEKKEEPPAA